MILCFIEFGVRAGAEELRNTLLAEMFAELEGFDGFNGKETFVDCANPQRIVTISYWSDREALGRWMRNRAHMRAIGTGKRDVFTHYNIKIAALDKETDWVAPPS